MNCLARARHNTLCLEAGANGLPGDGDRNLVCLGSARVRLLRRVVVLTKDEVVGVEVHGGSGGPVRRGRHGNSPASTKVVKTNHGVHYCSEVVETYLARTPKYSPCPHLVDMDGGEGETRCRG